MKNFKIIFVYLIYLSVFSLNALTTDQNKFLNAVTWDDLAVVKKCVEENNVSVNTYDLNNSLRVAINIAADKGNVNMVKYLLEKNAKTNTKDAAGNKPIHIAAKNGHLEIVRIILEKEFKEIDQKYPPTTNKLMNQLYRNYAINDGDNGKRFTPLHFAVDTGIPYNVKFFLLYDDIINVNAQDDFNNQPIHIAVKKGYKDIIEILLQKGAHINCENGNEQTPLHLAAAIGNLQIVQFLLSNGADINSKDNDGYQPLHLAAINNNLDIVKFLLSNGADINSQTNDGKSPLTLATEEGCENVVNFLKSKSSNGGFSSNELSKSIKKLHNSLINLKNKLTKLSKKLEKLKTNLAKKAVSSDSSN